MLFVVLSEYKDVYELVLEKIKYLRTSHLPPAPRMGFVRRTAY